MLTIENLSVDFNSSESNIRVVDEVNMAIEKGSKTCIIGESGSGKTVLLQALLRLLPKEAIISGRANYNNINLLNLRNKELEKIRGNKISYVPQGGGNSLNPLLKVGDQIGETLVEHRGFSKKEAFVESIKLLKRFNLGNEEKWANSYPHSFSGGMKQRVLIALGIAAGAEIILADEPTKGLDKSRIDIIIDLFRELKEETLVCVTHDLIFAREISNNISIMYAAQQIEFSPTEDFYNKPLHPYSQAILAALPENGLKCIDGYAPSHTIYNEKGCRFYDRCQYKMNKCKVKPPMFEQDGQRVRCWLYDN